MRRAYLWGISVGATCPFTLSFRALLGSGESGASGPRTFGAVAALKGA